MNGGAIFAWAFLTTYAAALLHVLLSPRSGPFRPPAGTRCPLGPRAGWLVLVLLLGQIGWVQYMRRRAAVRRPGTAAGVLSA